MRHQTAMTCWLMTVWRPPCLRTPLSQQTLCSHSQKFSYQQLQEAPVVPQGPRHLQESLLSSTPAFRTLHPTRPPTTSTAMVELGQPPQQGHRAALALLHLQRPGCAMVLDLGLWLGHPKAVLLPLVVLSTPGGPQPPPTTHTYRITQVSGELLVLWIKWILKVLAEAPVGDEEGERVDLEVKPGS